MTSDCKNQNRSTYFPLHPHLSSPSIYLHTHTPLQDQGSGWRFNTKRQVWLLKHLYNEEAMDKKFFKKYALPYIGTLQGGAKEVSVFICYGWSVFYLLVILHGLQGGKIKCASSLLLFPLTNYHACELLQLTN